MIEDSEEFRARARAEVAASLARPQKELSPKFFYDARGSELFEEITRLPEYYPTRTERRLLERWAAPWALEHRPATLVELGAGSARKTEILLRAMLEAGSGRQYVPVDVSAAFLEDTVRRLDRRFEPLQVRPLAADMTEALPVPEDLPHPILFALLGSTIGNFPDGEGAELLGRIRRRMGPADIFLLGADLRAGEGKSVELLEDAYNDGSGVTAEFNRNILRVLNRLVGTDFDPGAFEHRAFYDTGEGRIEMHLVSSKNQVVGLPGSGTITFREGETIRTEISAKYDRPTVEALYAQAGLRVGEWAEDEDGLYALVLARPA